MTHTFILLASYNGARFLNQQLDSLCKQIDVKLTCLINDDGSKDATVNVLKQYSDNDLRFSLLDLPVKRNATKAFLSLLAGAIVQDISGNIETNRLKNNNLFSYCDQDDIWLPNKLDAASQHIQATIQKTGANMAPVLYGGRTLAVTEDNREIGLSPLFARPPSFRNALVQSIMGGNTMVFNEPAAKAIALAGLCDVPAHDWLSYQIVSGVGGVVIYDPVPYVRYRQHGSNVVGSNLGWKARLNRLKRAWHGDFAQWNAANLRVLNRLSQHFTADNQAVLAWYNKACSSGAPWTRVYCLYKSGVYRQTFAQTCVLYCLCLMGRI